MPIKKPIKKKIVIVEKIKRPVGKPTIMTPEVLAKLDSAFSIGCSDREACLQAGISNDALYDYQTRNPEYSKRKESLKQRLILKARAELYKGLNNNPELALKVLERKLKKEFSLRTELTGEDGEPIKTQIFIGGRPLSLD